jgi:WD40 repeat protein
MSLAKLWRVLKRSSLHAKPIETATPPHHGLAKLFISYSRDDDERFVLRLYKDLTAHGIAVWWDRQSMDSRGQTFLQEILDAITAIDLLVLVVGPEAVRSDYVRAEWQYALKDEVCKIIVPILRLGDYSLVPTELAGLHCLDFRASRPYGNALLELLRQVSLPLTRPGTLHGVDPLPAHFLPRPEAVQGLRATVLADISRPTAITSARRTAALQGMGGIGKSVLAAAFARACDTRRSFTQGIIWVNVGQDPNAAAILRLVGHELGDTPEHYLDLETSVSRLAELFRDRVCLVVLDDVWDAAHAEPLIRSLGSRCRLLITTRDAGIAASLGAHEHRVDLLSEEGALRLLADWAERPLASLPGEARAVARECGNLPLALALCGAMARDDGGWTDILEALREADLAFITRKLPNYLYPDVLRALKVSVDGLARLDKDAARQYMELAVFPAEAVPEAAVLTLWLGPGGHRDERAARIARKLIATLHSKALIQQLQGEPPNRRIWLHDLQRDYLRAAQGETKNLHEKLLASYWRQCRDGWHTGPNDGYFFQQLPYHLREAGRKEELRQLLLGFDWIKAKLYATNIVALIADLRLLPDDETSRLVQGAIRLAGLVLTRDKTQLAAQLLGRLPPSEGAEIRRLLEHAKRTRGGLCLVPQTPSLALAGGPLLGILKGHTNEVTTAAITPDGRRVITGSGDHTLKMWDLETGAELVAFRGHAHSVRTAAVTADGRRLVSGSDDGTVKVWALATGDELRTLQGHTHRVTSIALTPDGRWAVSGSMDRTLRVWDLASGSECRTLKGHKGQVTAIALTPDGRLAVSGSEDHTLKVWDVQSGTELRSFTNRAGRVAALALTPDGLLAVFGSSDDSIKVWDLQTGSELRSLTGYSTWAKIALTPDGLRVVSGSVDRSLKMWDLTSGAELRSLTGPFHLGPAVAVAVAPDGRLAVCGHVDGTLEVWDLEASGELRMTSGHSDEVSALAVTSDGQRAVSGSWDNTVKIWDMNSRAELRTLSGHTDRITAVALTPDGRCVVSSSWDKTLRVWDVESGAQLRTFTGHKHQVAAVAVTPDGRRVVSASGLHIKVRDLASGVELQTFKVRSEVAALALTPDGRLAVALLATTDIMEVYDLVTGRRLRMLNHGDWVDALAAMPEGRRVVSSSHYANNIKLWDLDSGTELLTLTGQAGEVRAIAVTPDGRCLACAGYDHALKLWDLETRTVIASFSADSPLSACTIAPGGEMFLAGDSQGKVHFLRLAG